MPPRSRKRRRRSGADGRSSNYSDKLIESNVLRILEQQRAERSAASERNGTESRRQQQLGRFQVITMTHQAIATANVMMQDHRKIDS